jgi:hypothetical protein
MDEKQIFGLMAVAEDQQKAVATAIAGLAAERAALARERELLAQVAQGIQKATGDAVSAAVKQSLAGASETAVAAFTKAAGPFAGEVRRVAEQAGVAAEKVDRAAQWLGVKAVAVAAGCIVIVALAAWGIVAWERHEVVDLKKQIAQERATVADLDKEGGRVVWSTCGGRLCFEVSSNQGTSNGTPVPLGGWTTNKGHVPLVIPKGY